MAGLGALGYVGLGKESSGGIPVPTTAFFEALSEDVSNNPDRFEYVNIYGRLTQPRDMLGLNKIEGNLEIPVNAFNIGHILTAAIGPATVTSISAGLRRFSWKVNSLSQWDERFALQPYTLEVSRDVGSAQAYFGTQFGSTEFSVGPNQELRMSAGLMAIGEAIRATVPPTFPDSPTFPFAFDTASLSIGAQAFQDAENWSWTLENNLEAVGTLWNSRNVRKIRRTDFVMPMMAMTIELNNLTEYQNFLARQERAVSMSFTRADSFKLEFLLPSVEYTTFPMGMGDRGRIMVDVEARANYHAGSATSFEVGLTTVATAY